MINRGDWIQTYSGRRFYPADPLPEEIFIEDIAHALSMTCRFTGHVRLFHSVASHSILCSRLSLPEFKLEALLHDASEAYLADIARPVKRMLPDYQAIEKKVEKACALRFNLPWPMSEAVKEVDTKMLVTEAMALLVPWGEKWWQESHWPEPYKIDIQSWTPKEAEIEFLREFQANGGVL